MGKLVAALASSHAYALQEPNRWDAMRERTRERFKARYGAYPPLHAGVLDETPAVRQERYKRIRDGLNFLQQKLREEKPDALIVVGDDQDENYTELNLPQLALYVGNDFYLPDHGHPGGSSARLRYRCHSELSADILNGLIAEEFDVAFTKRFPNDVLLSHAHWQILARMMPEADIPIVPLFVNAIHVPAVNPNRCYRLGETLRKLVTEQSAVKRIAIYGSGGLSHFTSGYPWSHYKGTFSVGSISEDFDRHAVQLLSDGEGEKLASFTSQDLLDNGEIELRSWLVIAGAAGAVRPQLLVYEPFYSGVMGMGVGYWEL